MKRSKRAKKAEQDLSAPVDVARACVPESKPRHSDNLTVTLLGVAGFLFLLLVGFVYVYGAYGRPLVERLSRESGDVLYDKGTKAQERGQHDYAINLYQEALTLRFADKQYREWTSIRLAELLLETGRGDEAVAAIREVFQSSGGGGSDAKKQDLKLHYLLTAALRQSGHLAEAADAAQAWHDAAAAQNDVKSQTDALYNLGSIHSLDAQKDKALEAFLKGVELDPRSHNSLRAAELLHETGRDDEALAVLDEYLPTAAGTRAELARDLRGQIVGASVTGDASSTDEF